MACSARRSAASEFLALSSLASLAQSSSACLKKAGLPAAALQRSWPAGHADEVFEEALCKLQLRV
jgi:hypothetical protein